MEELDLRELFYYVKSKLFLIIIVFLIVLFGGVVYSVFIKTPLYKSTSSIILVSNTGGSDSLQNDVVLNEKLVDTYKEIVKSRSVLEESIEELDFDMSYDELLSSVEVEAVVNTEVIKISVVNVDPDDAVSLVEVITEIFSQEVMDLYNIENIKVLDDANTPEVPYNINLIMDMVIYFVIGITLSLLIVVVMFYFDKSIKNIEQIAAITDISVIGEIPLVTERGGKLYE